MKAKLILVSLDSVPTDLPEDPARFRRRALTEAVHELGHTWGLTHCPNSHCVMHFSNTLADTDVKGSTFCPRCQLQLNKAGKAEP